MKPIQTMDFCVTSSSKGLHGSGLKVGQRVLVTGTKPLPEKKSDPYLQRIYSLVLVVDDEGQVLIPNNETGEGDNGYKIYLVDPRCLTKLDEEDQVALMKGLNKDETPH